MKKLLPLVGLVCGFAGALPAQNLVNNGSFETPTVAAGTFVQRNTSATMGAWTVTAGAIDHIGTNFWQAAAGGQSVDMNSASAGTISQSLATAIGQPYVVHFALAGNPFGYSSKTLSVRWASNEVLRPVFPWATNHSFTNMAWTNYALVLTATGSLTRLEFASLTGTMPGAQGTTAFYGPVIDDVQVVPFTPPVLQTSPLSIIGLTLSWNTHPGLAYRLRSGNDLNDLVLWPPASNWLLATSTNLSFVVPYPLVSNRFYRVELGE